MPSTATITAFYTFTQNTKARASQVNTNFNVLRGHIIPIDPNTTTSNDITYDLGSSEHRWRYVYAQNLRLPAIVDGTTTAAEGNFALSGIISQGFMTTVALDFPNSTCTVATNGRPIIIGLKSAGATTSGGKIFLNTSANTLAGASIHLNLLRNGTTIASQLLTYTPQGTPAGFNLTLGWPPSSFSEVDFVSSGSYSYSLQGRVSSTLSLNQVSIDSCRLYAYEI